VLLGPYTNQHPSWQAFKMQTLKSAYHSREQGSGEAA